MTATPLPPALATPQVIIGNPELKANHNITQIVDVVSDYEKYPRLVNLLKEVGACVAHWGAGRLWGSPLAGTHLHWSGGR